MKTIPCRTAFDAEARQHLKPIRPFIWAFWMLLVLLGRGESLAVAAAQPQPEPPYRLDWFSLDAGGAQSTGGDFTLSGTLGQSDAGAQSGGNYQMMGGFWAVTLSPHDPELQPALRITHDEGEVTISWPDAATAFRLEESFTLGSPAWTEVSQTPFVMEGENRVTLPLSGATRFFRLRKP